ncbi:hypothetical protein [Ligilactobacillus equi]|uniref:Uncharacterized protein n=1 Tax=Ligilactobacillus equi DPC 6820 TaxID=1392007 RepID=V7HW96_9LACO|nr:hypothetical protein [Ligilactobacillus equi]ETA74514.1 hypothetical protein LEQ_0379 [Ligilactobacillus equi DPC 6820]
MNLRNQSKITVYVLYYTDIWRTRSEYSIAEMVTSKKELAEFLRNYLKNDWKEELEPLKQFWHNNTYDVDAINEKTHISDEETLDIVRALSMSDTNLIQALESQEIPYYDIGTLDIDLDTGSVDRDNI